MRIDKVENSKIGIGIFQLEVNKAAKFGRTLEQIQELADLTRLTITPQRPGAEPVYCTITIIVEPAHLGKGYLAFFSCPKCRRKARTLYYIGLELGCRVCFHLTYKKQDRRKDIVNRLVVDDKLREQYVNSWRLKHVKMAMEAQWAREAIIGRGYEIGQQFADKLSKKIG